MNTKDTIQILKLGSQVFLLASMIYLLLTLNNLNSTLKRNLEMQHQKIDNIQETFMENLRNNPNFIIVD